jgi:hypothetical protein
MRRATLAIGNSAIPAQPGNRVAAKNCGTRTLATYRICNGIYSEYRFAINPHRAGDRNLEISHLYATTAEQLDNGHFVRGICLSYERRFNGRWRCQRSAMVCQTRGGK